jgi:TatA/E family protein of Tat protein translocase
MLDNLLTPTHLIVVLVIALLIFGPRKLPELGKGLGEGLGAVSNYGFRRYAAILVSGTIPKQDGCVSLCVKAVLARLILETVPSG